MGECPNCGSRLVARKDKLVATAPRGPQKPKPTKAWYLAPIFLNILGGILGYLGVKDQDKKMAGRLLTIGVAVAIAGVVIGLIALHYRLI
jgi:hypothetical protein